MKRPIRDLRQWLSFLTKALLRHWTLRGTAEKLGVSYEMVRYYVLKYKLPYRYGNMTGWKFSKEDLKGLMAEIQRIKRKKHGMYQRLGRTGREIIGG